MYSFADCTAFRYIATSTGVEHLFSRGRILLSHIRNHLSAKNTRYILCLGEWYRAGIIKDSDFLAGAAEIE